MTALYLPVSYACSLFFVLAARVGDLRGVFLTGERGRIGIVGAGQPKKKKKKKTENGTKEKKKRRKKLGRNVTSS